MPTHRSRGTIRVHLRGFGFVVPTDETSPSAFVSPPDLNAFLDGDIVEATVSTTDDGRTAARDIRLLQRPRARVFGKVVAHRGGLFVEVDREVANRDWPLQPNCHPPIGSFVVASVQHDVLDVVRVLEPDADPVIERIIARNGLTAAFGPDAIAQAERAEDIPTRDGSRRDLRGTPTVTIDAASTRDLDDAFSVLPADGDGAVRLLVSISDVSAWVTSRSALDLEAFARATSVYLPDRVLPMLPPCLSEQRLSLLPGEDRACLTVELRISPEGSVSSVDLYRSLIRSSARLTYEEAAAFLDHGDLAPDVAPLRSMLTWSRTAWARLSMDRARRGGIELARQEARVGVDSETGKATVLSPYTMTSAHEMIERFMVAANEAVARWLSDRGVPAPYRVHDIPGEQAVARLSTIAANFGYHPGFAATLTPLAVAAFERQVRNAPASPAILAVIGKALGRARYTVVPDLHFGLATDRYLHFTSPIRRYADLLVHRAVAAYLDGDRPTDPRPAELEERCQALNDRTARAAKAELQARRAVSARFMASRIGEVFDANITSVLAQGLRVQLRGSLVTGWVPADALPDGPYALDAGSLELTGPKHRFAVGMPMRVRVERADEVQGSLDFSRVEPTG